MTEAERIKPLIEAWSKIRQDIEAVRDTYKTWLAEQPQYQRYAEELKALGKRLGVVEAAIEECRKNWQQVTMPLGDMADEG